MEQGQSEQTEQSKYIDPESRNDKEKVSRVTDQLLEYQLDEKYQNQSVHLPKSDLLYSEDQPQYQSDEEYSNNEQSSVENQQDNLQCSITEGQIRGQNYMERKRLFMPNTLSQQTVQTVIIDQSRVNIMPTEEENCQYFMGFFKWHWSTNGFLSTFWKYIGKKLLANCTYNFFFNVGIAIGAYFFKRLFIPNLGLTGYC